MKIVLAYVAVCGGPITEDYVSRFVTTWLKYPPGAEHDTLIIANGGPPSTAANLMLNNLGARMMVRHNDGWDVQGYIEAARSCCADYDAMLCLGESNYFFQPGWLRRLVQAWERNGEGMYGPFSSNAVRSHLNTTAFFTSPALLRSYPSHVVTREDRYEFEHGTRSLWRRVYERGLPVRLVTWDGFWEPERWRTPRNILWRGDQTNCLMWCSHTDNWVQMDPVRKVKWSRWADAPFK